MYRKIHSNRDPQVTLFSEIRQTFLPYFETWSNKITQKLKRQPKLIFGTMVCCILVSAGLTFTVFRNKEPAETSKSFKKPKVNVISNGFDQLTTTVNAIQQTIQLKRQIDSLTAKKTLSRQDSAILENDLDKLKP